MTAKEKEFRARIFRYILRLLKFLSKLAKNVVVQEIVRQLTKSGTSMGANFFEAKGASSKKDYLHFFTIALKSSNESIFWLSLLIKSDLISKNLIPEALDLLEEAKEIANIFASSILTMKGKK